MTMTKGVYELNYEGKDINLEHTFECGQCFRWRRIDDKRYIGIVGEDIVEVSVCDSEPKSKAKLKIKSISGELKNKNRDFWANYFDMQTNYENLQKSISRDDQVMQDAIAFGNGMRILNQDLWESIISFIISQNNNIPRIKGCIEKLCENFGYPINIDNAKFDLKGLSPYAIPSVEVLAKLQVEDLDSVKLGYRAKYIIKTAQAVVKNGLPKTLEEVEQLSGVGPKVANCIGLFGMGITSSFPIDVWVKRVMNVMYGFDEKDIKGMKAFADKKYGRWSGYAQQYLFYYMRSKEQ